MGPDGGPQLDWENTALQMVLDASQGLIGREVLAMSMQAEPSAIVVHVCLREDNDLIAVDLDYLVFELEALMAGIVEPPVDITIVKYVGDTDTNWPGYSHRRLYLVNDRERG